jgi:hypothetical protein
MEVKAPKSSVDTEDAVDTDIVLFEVDESAHKNRHAHDESWRLLMIILLLFLAHRRRHPNEKKYPNPRVHVVRLNPSDKIIVQGNNKVLLPRLQTRWVFVDDFLESIFRKKCADATEPAVNVYALYYPTDANENVVSRGGRWWVREIPRMKKIV